MHQCVSEDIWFRTMLDIDVGAPPLPKDEVRLEFMRRYAEDSEKRLAALRDKDETWWERETAFFDVRRSRAWVLTRRMTHSAHHRGQQLAIVPIGNPIGGRSWPANSGCSSHASSGSTEKREKSTLLSAN